MKEKDKILVVDDSYINLSLLESYLEGEDYTVITESSGKRALEIAEKESVDIILLDVMMPDIDGFEVCRQLKLSEKVKDVPVIFLTARSDSDSLVEGFNLGAVDYLKKPYRSIELLARVKAHLDLRKAKRQIEYELSEQLRIRKALHDSEERFRSIFEQAAVGILLIGKNGNLLKMNTKFSELMKYSVDELLQKKYSDITHNEDLKGDESLFQFIDEKTLKTSTREKRFICKNESIIWANVTLSGVYDSNGSLIYFVSVIENITRRKKSESRLIEQNDLLNSSINSLTHPFYIIDAESRKILKSNKATQLINKNNMRQLLEQCPIEKVKATKSPVQVEVFDNETDKYTEIHTYPVFDSEKNVTKLIEYSLDVTARKVAEMQNKQQLSESRFLANISQIFVKRLPMETAIQTALQMIGNQTEVHRITIFNNSDNFKKLPDYFLWTEKDNFQEINVSVKEELFKNYSNTDKIVLTSQNKDFRKLFTDLKTQSAILLPINFNDTVNAILIIEDNKTPHKWDGANGEMLKIVSNVISNAYQRYYVLQAINDSEEKMRNIFNSTKDAIIITNLNGILLDANQAFKDMTSYSDSELFWSENNIEFFDKKNFSLTKRLEKLHKENEYLIEGSIITKDGKSIPVEINEHILEYDGQKAIISVIRDITERKEIQRKILTTIIQTEEKERNRFSKDLHDGIGALLSSINIYLNLMDMNKVNTEELPLIISEMRELINEAIQSSKEIANNIKPNILMNFGLVESIHSFCERLNGTGKITISLDASSFDLKLENDIETILYRITNELINNTLKHAQAANAFIKLQNFDKSIKLTYIDNGIGFDFEQVLKHEGNNMGLRNIINRVKTLNGNCTILSKPNEGFKIEIIINQ